MTGPAPEQQPRAPMGPDFDETRPYPIPPMSQPAGAPNPTDGSPTLPDVRAAEARQAANQAQAAAADTSAEQARAAANQAQAAAANVPPPIVEPAVPAPARPWPIVERSRTEIREHPRRAAIIGAGTAVALLACLACGYLNADRFQRAWAALTGTEYGAPTTGSAAGGPEGCTVTPLLNQAPNGSALTIKVGAHETVQGGLWWQNGNYPWGSNEVGVQFQGGDSGLTVTTNGSAGGSLWEYSEGCSTQKVNGDRASYDTSRRANTNFAGDESLQQLQSAGAVNSQQSAFAGKIPMLDARFALPSHDRIAANTAARIRREMPLWRRALPL